MGKIAYRALLALCVLSVLCSCARAEADPPALVVDGVEVSRAEAEFYMLSAQNVYSEIAAYYEIFLGIDYWRLTDVSGATMFDMVKADVFRELLMMNVFYARAEDMGIKLNEADEMACASDAEALFERLALGENSQIGRADVERVLIKQKLADRVYSLLVAQTPIDERAVRESVNADMCVLYELEYLFTPNTRPTQDGRLAPLTDAQREQRVEALKSTANAPDWESALKTRDDDILAYGALTFLSGDEDIDEALKSAAARLEKGETSGVITTDAGWFILRLIDNMSPEGYTAVLETALGEARKAAFQARYDQIYTEAVYEFDIYFWNTLSPDGGARVSD